ncbi:hypothetical protein LP419_22600 [Massilia sp. H-1]|nr:hypothetical protein LP419_22600 [Massilia sp. H-1]
MGHRADRLDLATLDFDADPLAPCTRPDIEQASAIDRLNCGLATAGQKEKAGDG